MITTELVLETILTGQFCIQPKLTFFRKVIDGFHYEVVRVQESYIEKFPDEYDKEFVVEKWERDTYKKLETRELTESEKAVYLLRMEK